MANRPDSVDAICPIRSPAEKFYNFFKNNMNELVNIFPAAFTEVKVLEGEEGSVGCVKQWTYVLGGITLTAKVLIEAIDDAAKSITFTVQEGDVLQLYKSFKAILSVSEGSAKWTFEYEKTNLLTPPPELYIPLAITASTLVDAYLLIN
ncbi:hypothetical protein CDL12_29264 [Handroanthus impetiginosus]|uniref:Bet v I/Major latex protein domain-containing protein n=1 Tax=Handroanthus impetiginosus TaxID=429701 RepID=A0A2G9FYW8_9LAMI|nr:hypothetical protein CDL12_29264 [Handroanthus impetiginosus]